MMTVVVVLVVMTIMMIVKYSSLKFPISDEGASSPEREALPTAIDRDHHCLTLSWARPQNKNLILKLFILIQFKITFLIIIQGLPLICWYWCVLSLRSFVFVR